MNIVGAAVLWFVARRLIQFAGSIEGADTASLDVTIAGYIQLANFAAGVRFCDRWPCHGNLAITIDTRITCRQL
jgi:hypothetical protein